MIFLTKSEPDLTKETSDLTKSEADLPKSKPDLIKKTSDLTKSVSDLGTLFNGKGALTTDLTKSMTDKGTSPADLAGFAVHLIRPAATFSPSDAKKELFRNHPGLTRVIEQAAGVHDGADVAERFELDDFAGRLDRDRGGVEVNGHDVAGLQGVAEAFGDFARIEFAGGDGVAEENARETFGEDDPATGRSERDGRVFA
jgi:hypothetical protein